MFVKRWLVCIVAVMLIAGLLLPACAAQPKGPIELKMATFLPAVTYDVKEVLKTIAKINERAKGELVVTYVGGPEAVPVPEQPMAVKKGVIDIGFFPAAVYMGLTAAPNMLVISEITPWEERESGAHDFLVEIHEKAGLYYLGRMSSPQGFFYFCVNKRIERPQELKGLRFNGGMMWDAMLKALGAQSVDMQIGEIYTAMERGLLDGHGNAIQTTAVMRLAEVTKYIIDHGYVATNVTWVMNLDKWNSLPKKLKDLLVEVKMEREYEEMDAYIAFINKSKQDVLAAGVQSIKFSPADAKWYIDTIIKSQYDNMAAKAPVDGPKLYEMLKKEALKK